MSGERIRREVPHFLLRQALASRETTPERKKETDEAADKIIGKPVGVSSRGRRGKELIPGVEPEWISISGYHVLTICTSR